MGKPFSAACERNAAPILEVLRGHFADRRQVLEVGSGTGQHAVRFGEALPSLTWQCSDRAEYLDGIRAWLADAALPNTPPPLLLDVGSTWPRLPPGCPDFDAVFTANTLHIMSWSEVQQFFAGVSALCDADARLAIYGPFNQGGRFTSPGNAAFDAELRARSKHMGLRDIEAVDGLAAAAGFRLREDRPLPANNRCIVWQRGPH